MVKNISQNELEQEIASGITVVDFYANWCGPCKMLSPVMEEISGEMEGKIKFLKMDVDQNEEAAAKYRIVSIPALLIFKDGEKQEMLVGFQPKDALKAQFEKYLA